MIPAKSVEQLQFKQSRLIREVNIVVVDSFYNFLCEALL